MTDTDTTPEAALSAIAELLDHYNVPVIVATLVVNYGSLKFKQGWDAAGVAAKERRAIMAADELAEGA